MASLAGEQEYSKTAGQPTGGRLWPAALAGIVMVTAILALELFTIRPDQPAGLVVSADRSAESVMVDVVAAGGLPLRIEQSALGGAKIWVVQPGEPAFFETMRSRGYWLIVNPWAFGGCLIKSRR